MKTIRINSFVTMGLLLLWISPYFMQVYVNTELKAIRIVIMAILLTKNIHFLELKKSNAVIWFGIMYAVSVLFSTVLKNPTWKPIMNGLSSVSVMLGMFIYYRDALERKMMSIIDGTFYYLTVFTVMDAFIAFFTANGLYQNEMGQPIFFTGGKFEVCYCYITWIVVSLVKKHLENYKVHWMEYVFMAAWGMLLTAKVDCATGLLCIAACIGVCMFPYFSKILSNVKFLVIIFALLNYLIIIYRAQERMEILRYFITNILHRAIHITGRFDIYSKFGDMMKGNWLLGYGYSTDIVYQFTKLANAQNAFLQIVTVCGLVGLVLYMIFLLLALFPLKKVQSTFLKRILAAGMIAFLISAIVEIPFGPYFYIILTCVYGIRNIENKEEKNM